MERVMAMSEWLLAAAAATAGEPQGCWPDDFRDQLLARAAEDQEARRQVVADPTNAEANQRALAVDRANTAWLRPLVRACGWPARSAIGEDAARAAWLIAQHADMTPEFQREAAAAMLASVQAGEANGAQLASLVDRHARLQKIPQTYGMQFTIEGGVMRFLPIKHPEQLDARLKVIGLRPFACYVERMQTDLGATAEWPAGVPRALCPPREP
jgi:hypothetical protein